MEKHSVVEDLLQPQIYLPEYDPGRKERYEVQKRIGEGSFGEVRKAIDRFTGATVALKSIRSTGARGIPRAAFRELTILRQLDHYRVTRLLDVFPDESNLVLVQEYLPSDLAEVVEQSTAPVPRANFKRYAFMLLDALNFIHSQGIIHRDIKPSNLLIGADGGLRLGDFGLARVLPENGGSMSHQVATRWYRAPELLFGARKYGVASDIWSAAVVLAELLILRPLFPGENDIDQMFKVIQIMGAPTPENWPGVVDLPDYGKLSFSNMAPLNLQELFPAVHEEDWHFVQTMLRLDPSTRHTAEQALQSLYFQNVPLPCDAHDMPIFLREDNSRTKKAKGVTFKAGAPVLQFDNPSPFEQIMRTLQR